MNYVATAMYCIALKIPGLKTSTYEFSFFYCNIFSTFYDYTLEHNLSCEICDYKPILYWVSERSLSSSKSQ